MATTEDDNGACPEIERGVTNHPLADDRERSSIASTSSSAYAAELVQSAARSLLDASTSQLSDDESCLPRTASPTLMASLSSLKQETLPAVPDVQDRKRFIVRQRYVLMIFLENCESHIYFFFLTGLSRIHFGLIV
jgi:hypothetical protein